MPYAWKVVNALLKICMYTFFARVVRTLFADVGVTLLAILNAICIQRKDFGNSNHTRIVNSNAVSSKSAQEEPKEAFP